MDCRAKHSMALLERLQAMRDTDELTDVVLVAEGVSFPCHRVVLSAFSPYFRAMFTCGLRECHRREVVLQDSAPESLGLIIDYMYRGELPLSNGNVQGVSITAFLLQIEEVFQLCQEHMVDNMDPSNCLGLYLYAQDLGAEGLAGQARRYLCRHFVEVCLNQEVLELEPQQLAALIGSDDLNVSREESVLELVLRWIEHRRARREEHAPELLRRVRLALVEPGFLRRARRRNTALLCNSECFSAIDVALRSSSLASATNAATGARRPQLRYGMETTSLLLCVGRSQSGLSYGDRSFCYAPSTGRACFISSPLCGEEEPGCISAGVVTEDNDIVVAGEAGDRKRSWSMTIDVYRYELSLGSWAKLCSAGYRDMYALGALGDTLYLLGGQMKLMKQYCITDCVESQSLQGGPWRSSAPLPIPLACHCAVSLRNRLYVLGGWTPQSTRPDDEPDSLSDRVFQLDAAGDRWTECRRMSFSRYRCSAAVLNGEIYVLGGIGCEGEDRGQSRHCLDAVEIYNPDGDFWREGPPLPSPLLSLRSNASNVGVVEGKLYVCGYYKGADRHEVITKDILELDPRHNRWTVVARHVQMHDSYDVCLVASLNPRDLLAPPPEIYLPTLSSQCGEEDDNPTMGRRESGDSGTMSTSERTELGSLQGTASSDDGSSAGRRRSASADTRPHADKKSSPQPTRALAAAVKKHQHKHNLKHWYDVLETLGKGTYGKVKKAVERGSGKTVAIKSIRKERITDDLDRVHIQREIEIISCLKHPNIIRIHEVFESKDKIVIVMEYASQGELYDHVNERRRLPEPEARDIFRQITSAVHYCHKNGVVHRDLKLENILLDQDFNVKLADFGLSNHYHRGHLLQTYCGSPLYASPEIVKGLPYQGPEVDCWALGVLLYALVYGSMPFDGVDYKTLTKQISQAQYRRPQPPSDACALIDWMLTVKVEERATVEDIANHWWVNWSYEEPVCDCHCSQDCPSPLLARYIDWQNRAPCDPRSVCPAPADPQYYFSFPLKPPPAGSRGASCLKKSRKENVISQPAHAATAHSAIATGTATATTTDRKPKGILKTQSSVDTAILPLRPAWESPALRQEYPAVSAGAARPQTLPVCRQPSSKMPKKGILKKLYEGESGYYSSPERGDGGGERAPRTDGGIGCPARHASREEGSTRTGAVRKRKGILKRNGKFSASLDLPDEQVTALHFPESLQQLLLSTGGAVTSAQAQGEGQQWPQQDALASSRPASVISDDSFLSSDSFDLLDMAVHSHRALFSRRGRRSVYSSEEEVDEQDAGRQGGRGKREEEEVSLEERREVFRQAQEITEQL
ncbi:hypothetical protein AAFF_G00042510 [Aldrovandia affinis]|uniref:non-specific serine/threonine protein kinase n=1 Tax=Aldrovandia affinis TaxID=143900 RepID=A0AAD7S4Z9_9TELE|nr:hypothetical protein AAFF_G00042510 [Aldrovandia affinis]